MFWHFVSICACVRAAVEEKVSESAVPKWSNLTYFWNQPLQPAVCCTIDWCCPLRMENAENQLELVGIICISDIWTDNHKCRLSQVSAKTFRTMLEFLFLFCFVWFFVNGFSQEAVKPIWQERYLEPSLKGISVQWWDSRCLRNTPHSSNSYWKKNHVNNFESSAQPQTKTLGETDGRWQVSQMKFTTKTSAIIYSAGGNERLSNWKLLKHHVNIFQG